MPLVAARLPLIGDPLHVPALHHPAAGDPVVRFTAPYPMTGAPHVALPGRRGVFGLWGWRWHVGVYVAGKTYGGEHDLGSRQADCRDPSVASIHRPSPWEPRVNESYDIRLICQCHRGHLEARARAPARWMAEKVRNSASIAATDSQRLANCPLPK